MRAKINLTSVKPFYDFFYFKCEGVRYQNDQSKRLTHDHYNQKQHMISHNELM
jgi:hypothetical protein